MTDRSTFKPIALLAGPFTTLAILLLVTVIALCGAPVLESNKNVATDIATKVVIERANTIAQALIASGDALPDVWQAPDGSSRVVHLRGVLKDSRPMIPYSRFVTEKVAALRNTPNAAFSNFFLRGTDLHFHYLVADGRAGALLIDIPIDRERAIIGRPFGQSYIAASTVAYAIIGLLLIAGVAFRAHLRGFANLPAAEREATAAGILRPSHEHRRYNLLPWLMALCLAVFTAEITDRFSDYSGILYVLAAVVALSSSRPWHVLAIATLGAMLTTFAPLFTAYSPHWWAHLQAHSVTIFALIATGLFGSKLLRNADAEARALADARQAQRENVASRDALARAEQAEVAHRHVFERMSLAMECAGISVWEWDLKTNLVTASEGGPFSQRFGGRTVVNLDDTNGVVLPEDHAGYRKVFVDALDTNSTTELISHRYRIRTTDQSTRWIEFFGRVFRKPNGRVIRILGIDWEITTEVEAVQALGAQAERLAETERRLERTSLLSMVGFFEIDLQNASQPAWFSDGYGALLGYTPAELGAMGDRLIELTHPDDREMQRKSLDAHARTGVAYDFAVRMQTKAGEYRWFRMRGATERDATGLVIRSGGALQDIQRQKHAEDALRLIEGRFRRAIAGTRDAVFDLDVATGIFWLSPRWYEMLGFAPDEFQLTSGNLHEWVHAEDIGQLNGAFTAHFKGREPFNVEYRLRGKNGEYLWVRSRGEAERDERGWAIRFSGSTQDITEERTSREALMLASEAAEEASRAKTSFLATMSHEIRTPMNGIIGMTGLLLDTALDRTQRDYAETVRSSADSLLTILNDILDFSKIEAGKLEIETIEMDLRSNVEDVGAIMAFQAAAKNLELIVNVHPEVPDYVVGDPQRIRQCLLNLVGNAIKFTATGEVLVDVCMLGHKDGRPLVHFEIRDTGMGIPADTLGRLFKPFTQADSSTTRRFGGTGLGLSIVRRLVELMSGQTGADSELGKGSAFWFTLPLETARESEADRPARAARANASLLLVDDNETNRRVLTGQLAHAGYRVTSASTPQEAFALWRASASMPFDIVLLDYQMPDIDGEALGQQIMAASDLPPTRLVLLTSLDHSGDMQKFADIGFAAYLTKPIRTRELLSCLERVLARHTEPWNMRSQPIITRGTLLAREEHPRLDAKILLVEDNVINQRVAQRFLERLGCEVEIAADGAQGVDAFRTGDHDFILMDMQMPVMDGIEATQRIRELEAGRTRIPIVALTANVMAGQLERCLDAGMDDCLTKPLDIARLEDSLDRFLRHRMRTSGQRVASSAITAAAEPATDVPQAVIDRLRDIAGDDREFMEELIATFIIGGEETLRELRAASARADHLAVGRAAHKLKGASANLHVEPLASRAEALETRAKSQGAGDWQREVDTIAVEFEKAVRQLKRAAGGG